MTSVKPVRPARLAVVSAGLSEPSSTRLLADRLTEATRVALADRDTEAGATGADGASGADGVEVEVVELRDVAREIANAFVTGLTGDELRRGVGKVTEADGLIAVTPVFSASYSGLFKSFFDVVGMTDNDALTGKPTLLGATGGSPRHSLVLEHAMRPLFTYLRAVTVPTAVYAATDDWAAPDDGLTPSLPRRVARAGGELAGLVAPRADTRAAPSDSLEVLPFEQQLSALRVERP
ncbi:MULTISPECIES: FMN reductase [unclassified Streptomyces]|uniref:FMN reductase n=1 Tax=unclassified Streptomyces TaxID=2593676 RepID=UPI002E13DC83|nr:FMN reductase [Streptomyces sp. NBC_01186]WSS40934.1 FMN reductase [Streptomyces sp. NBC_01187]